MTNLTATTSTATTIGLDVGDRVTHLCGLDAARNVVIRQRFATTRDGLRSKLSKVEPCHIVLEAGTHSPWMAAEIRSHGHHRVQVADPRRIALIHKSSKKTDRRDAEVLARQKYAQLTKRCGSVPP